MSTSRHIICGPQSAEEDFGINAWDVEININYLENLPNPLVGIDESMSAGLDSTISVRDRIIITYKDDTPVDIEGLDAEDEVGIEIFNHMDEANGPNVHEILWNPDTLYQWSVAVCYIGFWLDRRGGLARCSKAGFVLSAARFGLAVMFSADKTAMQAALEEVKTENFRTNEEWFKLINPENHKRVREAVPGSNLCTKLPVPRDDGAGYQYRMVPDIDLLSVAIEIVEGWYFTVQERFTARREMVRSQAIAGVICAMDMDDSDQHCTICLDPFGGDNSEGDGENLGHIAVRTTCNHLFGVTCFSDWMKDHDRCPLCRQKLTGEGRLRNPRDEKGATRARMAPRVEKRKVNKQDVQTIRKGFLAWDGLSLDAKQHAACRNFILAGQTQDAYDIILQQQQTLMAVDKFMGGPHCPILEGCPSLRLLVWTSFRDDWNQLSRNVSSLIDELAEKKGDWNTWSNLQIKELKRMPKKINQRLIC